MKKVHLKNAVRPKEKVVVDTNRPVADTFANPSQKTEDKNVRIKLCEQCIAEDPAFLFPYIEIAEAHIASGNYRAALDIYAKGAREALAIIFENDQECEDGCVCVPYSEETNRHLFHFLNSYAKALWAIGRREDTRELLEMIAGLDESDPLLVVPDVLALSMGFGPDWKQALVAGARPEHATRHIMAWALKHAPLYPDIFVIEDVAELIEENARTDDALSGEETGGKENVPLQRVMVVPSSSPTPLYAHDTDQN